MHLLKKTFNVFFPRVRLIIIYKSDEYYSWLETKYVFYKDIFIFNIFRIIWNIIGLKIEPSKILYDFENYKFCIFFETDENVKRYYHGDAKELMLPLVNKYKQHGWKLKEETK